MTLNPPPLSRAARWPSVAALLAVGLPALFVSLRPIDDADIFWQVKMGRLILDHGFHLTEPFSYRHPDQPIAYIGWLGQVLFAAAHAALGWEGVQVLNVMAFIVAFVLVWLRVSHTCTSPRPAVGATLLCFLPCMTNCSERPQTLAYALFVALFCATEWALPPRRYWLILVPLLLAWQNIHPSLPVVAAVLGLRAAGAWLDARSEPSLACTFWRRPMATAAAATIAIFCTPAGAGILEISARNGQLSRWLGIGEWQPAYAVWPASSGFFAVMLVAVVLWRRGRTRLPWRDVLPLLCLTAAALACARLAVFWALFLAPSLARLVHEGGPALLREPRTIQTRPGMVRRLVPTVVTAGMLVAASPWMRPHLAVLPASCRALLDPQFPINAAEHLAEVLPAGRIYNYREWAGVLVSVGPPEWRVAIDGRVYRYDEADWVTYNRVALAAAGYATALLRQRPDALFLRPGHDDALIQAVRLDPIWRESHRDSTAFVFLRADMTLASRKPTAE